MKKIVAVVVFIMIQSVVAFSQCAMCRATAESATEHTDKGIGEALNSGIVYLMLVPYVIFIVLGVVFFRKKWAAWFKTSTIS